MSAREEFRPAWVSKPGATIDDILVERKMTRGQLARELDCALSFVEDLIAGHEVVNEIVALKLERSVGSTARFWLAREASYRRDLERLFGNDEPADRQAWLSRLPLRDMRSFGWIGGRGARSAEVECLKFFAVSGVKEWTRKYEGPISLAAFRSSAAFETNPAAVAAWIRKGELEAISTQCDNWNPITFQKSLPEVRKLTRLKSPGTFLPELKRICAACGVAAVIVRAPDGCRASGAARFLGPRKAVIQLSFRYRTDDQFWFTFFHEAGHLLLHREKGPFLDGLEGEDSVDEKEANRFALNVLLADDQLRELLDMKPTYRSVIRFALKAGVSAGIVVGQLQHAARVERSRLNRVKRTFKWEDVGA